MWFKELENKMFKFTEGFIKNTAKTLSSSSFTISSKDELKGFIQRSKNILFEDTKRKQKKTFIKRVIVIFGDEKTDFFQKALIKLPILWTKAFSQNMLIKLAKSSIKLLRLEEYKVKKLPSMVVFEDTKIYKVIEWEENILKVVKSLSLDINKTIEKL